MLEPARQSGRAQAGVFGHDGFGNFLQRYQMGRGIAVAPGVVGNDGAAFLEEFQEWLKVQR